MLLPCLTLSILKQTRARTNNQKLATVVKGLMASFCIFLLRGTHSKQMLHFFRIEELVLITKASFGGLLCRKKDQCLKRQRLLASHGGQCPAYCIHRAASLRLNIHKEKSRIVRLITLLSQSFR